MLSDWQFLNVRKLRGLSAAMVLTTVLFIFNCANSTSTRAQSFQGLGILPGYTDSNALAVSSDGSVVVGSSYTNITGQATRWTATSGLGGLGYLPGDSQSAAFAVNSDGSIIVGSSSQNGGGSAQAFRWTSGVGMVGLGYLPGNNYSSATGVSGDGSVVVGNSSTQGNCCDTRVFRWTAGGGMAALPAIAGYSVGYAFGVSIDGSAVVGVSYLNSLSQAQAFLWTAGSGTAGLGYLPGGTNSFASAANTNGTVVVGGSTSANDIHNYEAFRWTQAGGMLGLGFLPGYNYSSPTAVSPDGSIIVGCSGPSGLCSAAFRWTAAKGMQSVQGILTTSGVNMSGWSLTSAQGISADGSVIVGLGQNPSHQTEAWIARLSPQFGNGIITSRVVAESFSGQFAITQTGNAALGNGLGTFTEYATQAGMSQGSRSTPYSIFSYGGYDSDPAASGTLGITVNLPNAMVGGAAVSANYVKTDMVYDGNSKLAGGSAGLFVARMPSNGLQWLIGVNGITLRGDIVRGYLNGSGLATSTGSTAGIGYGATARVGWSFDLLPKTQVTPFASYACTSIHYNGYAETDGPFPAQFGPFSSTAQTSRLGADARYTFAPGSWLWGTLAWAHRMDGGKGGDISGVLVGLFALSAAGASVAQDWTEVTGGVRWPIWQNGAMTASLTASVPTNFPATYAARVGLTQAF